MSLPPTLVRYGGRFLSRYRCTISEGPARDATSNEEYRPPSDLGHRPSGQSCPTSNSGRTVTRRRFIPVEPPGWQSHPPLAGQISTGNNSSRGEQSCSAKGSRIAGIRFRECLAWSFRAISAFGVLRGSVSFASTATGGRMYLPGRSLAKGQRDEHGKARSCCIAR